jgi:hypothetical protein
MALTKSISNLSLIIPLSSPLVLSIGKKGYQKTLPLFSIVFTHIASRFWKLIPFFGMSVDFKRNQRIMTP